jgi:hypothetical protein
MLVNFIQFLANLIIALTILKVATVHLVKRNSDSPGAQALAFLVG